MFARPFFPSSSLFSSPFSHSSWFGADPFLDEWNELLNNQYQQQQALRQRMQQQQQQQQPIRRIQPKDPQQSQQQPTTTTSTSNEQQAPTTTPPSAATEHKQSCEASCNKECNTNNNCATTCGTKCQTNCNKDKQVVSSAPASGNGAVARPRSFWDLASFPSWSGLTSQSIRLEWSGTEPDAKEYVVSAYLPDDITPADVSISMDERTRMLTLKCQSKSHEEEKDRDGNIISSRSSSSFSQRSLQLPQDVDINAISASKNQSAATGANSPQLLLHLPKLAAPVPQPGVKQIAIN